MQVPTHFYTVREVHSYKGCKLVTEDWHGTARRVRVTYGGTFKGMTFTSLEAAKRFIDRYVA